MYTRSILSLTTAGGGKTCCDTLQSDVVKWLRFPMSVLVVFIHFAGITLTEAGIGNIIYDNIRYFLSDIISLAAVPTFFVISGYYFFYNSHFSLAVYKQKLKKRIKTLLLPYIIWNSIMLINVFSHNLWDFFANGKSLSSIIDYCRKYGWFDLYWSCNEWEGRTNWLAEQITHTSPVLGTMWFIRDLIVVILFSPIIYWAIKNKGKLFLLLLFIINMSSIWISIPGLSDTALFYFTIGAYFSINKKNIVCELSKHKYIILSLITLLLPTIIYLNGKDTAIGNIIHPFFVLVLVATYFNIATIMVKKHYMMRFIVWGKASFFIFACHLILILSFSDKIMLKCIPSNYWLLATMRYILTPLLCVWICYWLFFFIHRYTPKLCLVLTGDRG